MGKVEFARRRVVLVYWKDRKEGAIEVFSNLKVFSESYLGYSYHTLNNYLSKKKIPFEDERLRIERKDLINQPLVSDPSLESPFRMEAVVRRTALKDLNEAADDVEYWLSRPPAERLAAVTFIVSQSLKPGERMDKTIVKKRKM